MKIKSILSKLFSSKGFTLIELLIVIAILGILAAGILVAINPIQKTNQAKDANAKSDVSQIAQALQAYLTTNNVYPPDLATLVTSKELKVLPTTSIAYTISGGEVSLSYTLLAPATAANNFWCWRSVTGITAAVATCAP